MLRLNIGLLICIGSISNINQSYHVGLKCITEDLFCSRLLLTDRPYPFLTMLEFEENVVSVDNELVDLADKFEDENSKSIGAF